VGETVGGVGEGHPVQPRKDSSAEAWHTATAVPSI